MKHWLQSIISCPPLPPWHLGAVVRWTDVETVDRARPLGIKPRRIIRWCGRNRQLAEVGRGQRTGETWGIRETREMASEMAESVDVRNINERRKSQASPLPGLCFMAVKIENKVCRDRKKYTLSPKGGIKARICGQQKRFSFGFLGNELLKVKSIKFNRNIMNLDSRSAKLRSL